MARSETATGSSSKTTRPAAASSSIWGATRASRPTSPNPIRRRSRSWPPNSPPGGRTSTPRCPRPTRPTPPTPSSRTARSNCRPAPAIVHGAMLRYEPLPHKNTLGYWVRCRRLGIVGIRRHEARNVRGYGTDRLRQWQWWKHGRVPGGGPDARAHRPGDGGLPAVRAASPGQGHPRSRRPLSVGSPRDQEARARP